MVTTDPYYGLYTGSLQMAFGGDDKIERQLKTLSAETGTPDG
ncbi:MAG: hypothetical protein R2857_04380 [Vampirovibrionales bacterium]